MLNSFLLEIQTLFLYVEGTVVTDHATPVHHWLVCSDHPLPTCHRHAHVATHLWNGNCTITSLWYRTVGLTSQPWVDINRRHYLFPLQQCDRRKSVMLITDGMSLRVSFWWLGSVTASASDLWSEGRGFDSRPEHCLAATLGKLFTSIVPLSPSSIIWYLVRAFMLSR